jgi:plasmid stabilization system protein ParE
MTEKTVEFHPAAAEEAETARQWYAERSLVAARAFLRELMHAVEQVTEAPERWPSYEYDTRRYFFPRFPFSLIYRVADDKIQIIAVAHAKRKPGYWKQR